MFLIKKKYLINNNVPNNISDPYTYHSFFPFFQKNFWL